MRKTVILVAAVLSGCAAIPVQETTLKNDQGGTVTCKQVGRGIVSYGVGKHLYEECLANAKAQGYR